MTFLALLEMIRLKLIRVFQSGSFGPIRVYKRDASCRCAAPASRILSGCIGIITPATSDEHEE